MPFLSPIASLLGIEVDGLVERVKTNAVAVAIMVLFGLIAITFLLMAANVVLSDWVGPLYSPLIIAGVALLVVLVTWLVARMAQKRQHRRIAERRLSADTTALMATAAVTALPLLMRNPAMRALVIPAGATIAYFMLKRKAHKGDDD